MDMSKNNMETASYFSRPKTNESRRVMSRHDNGAYSRMQFLALVSHSMVVHIKALCLTA